MATQRVTPSGVVEHSQCASHEPAGVPGARLAKVEAHVAESVGPRQVVQPECRLLKHGVQLPAACTSGGAEDELQAMM